MRKIIGLASTFIGALIGAGFASGREIALYFANTSIIAPLVSGLLFGVFCYLFLELGRIHNNNFPIIFGKFENVFIFFIKLFNFIYICAMLAGSEIIIKNIFGINGGCIITGILGIITIVLGTEKLKDINTIVVIGIFILIIILFTHCHNSFVFIKIGLLPAFTYAGMNVLTSGYFISKICGNPTKKQNICCGIIVGGVLSFILCITYLIISNNFDAVMPLIETASIYNLALVGNIIMYLAIYTTVISSLAVVSDQKLPNAILVICFANIISIFSFENIVNSIYPIIGIISSLIIIIIVFLNAKPKYFVKLKQSYKL
ncbi:MAG: hypothetical protein WCR54_01815 [Clostridia bacterium]